MSTPTIHSKLDFEVLINESFMSINTDKNLTLINNKSVLSIINGFADGKWMYKEFQNFIWDNITETSLSARERESLINKEQSALMAAAQNLRLTDEDDDISRGSELAEIVLYGIMKHHYGALSVVPKIFYKQNTQDNAKGADSVHIVLDNDNDFSIWFGEAKFYNSIEDTRLSSIITSVGNSLNTEKLKKENSIITNVSDIDFLIKDENLKSLIRQSLSPSKSIDLLKPKLHIPILLLHECNITKKHNTISIDYKDEIKSYHKQRAQSFFKKQIKKLSTSIHMYSEVKFHIILFPVPSKDEIVNKFITNASFYRS